MTSWSHSKKTRWGSSKFKKSSTSTKKLELSSWSYPKNLHIVIFQNSSSSFLGILTTKVSQLSVIQAAKSLFFLWLHGPELRIFWQSNWFLTGLGFTPDFPRLRISETSGYGHFLDRVPHKDTSLLRYHHHAVLNKTILHRTDAHMLQMCPKPSLWKISCHRKVCPHFRIKANLTLILPKGRRKRKRCELWWE